VENEQMVLTLFGVPVKANSQRVVALALLSALLGAGAPA
jgi:hypothetical protein